MFTALVATAPCWLSAVADVIVTTVVLCDIITK